MKILMLYTSDCDGISDYMVTIINSKTNLKELFAKNKEKIKEKILENGNLCIKIFSQDNFNDFLNTEFYSLNKKYLFVKCLTLKDIEKF